MTGFLLGTTVGLVAGYAWCRHKWRSKLSSLTTRLRQMPPNGAAPPGSPFSAEGLDPAMSDLLRVLDGAMRGWNERMENAERARAMLEQALDRMTDGVIAVDASGAVRFLNRRATQILGTTPEPVAGRRLIDLLRQPEVHALVRRAAREPAQGTSRCVRLRLPGAEVVQASSTAIPALSGEADLVLIVLRDMTEAERIDRMRRDFVANVSHELRTPLAAIRGYSETLLESVRGEDAEARRFVEIIHRHAERLGRLVDDLLVLSELEAGEGLVRLHPVDPKEIVAHATDTLAGEAFGRAVRVRVEVDPTVPRIEADPDRLEQALLNLLDNALKYSPHGGEVVVALRHAAAPEDEANAGWVEISVTDRGPGIPPAEIPRVTERFYRVDKARSRELGGTGLGLSIVRHIAELHRGRLEIQSRVGHGTTARLRLPVRRPGQAVDR